MRKWALSSMAVSVIGCVGDVGRSPPQALRGTRGVDLFDDPPGPAASATVRIDLRTTSCTGTLIAPRLVLTGAHCLLTGNTPRVFFDGGVRMSVVDCFVHPEAVGGTTLSSCEEVAGRRENEIVIHHDLALLELEADAPVAARQVSPPRWCLGAAPGSALAESRGMRVRGLRRQRREGIPSSYRSLGSSGTEYVLCFHEDVVQRGDSGGTVVASSDPAGPVVAANSEFGQGTSCNRQPLLWQHYPGPGPLGAGGLVNIDWLWSILDPGGSCSFGSAGPCLPARLGATLPDTDGDGLPDVRDLCPADALSAADAAACNGQHCDVDRDWVGDECDAHDGIDPVSGTPNGEVVACEHDDADRDGIPGPADPCPRIHADFTDPTDSDGDGVPNVCDVCPDLDDTAVDFSADEDTDGIPDVCDNCVMVPNPLQSDCNLDAELALWQVRCPPGPTGEPSCPRRDFTLGDACDPTPCGETEVAREAHTARVGDPPMRVRQIHQNAVRVDARASTPRDARTGFRFCRCRFVTRDDLEQREVCVPVDTVSNPDGPPSILGGCEPLDTPAYDALTEPRNWRWTTMAFALDPRRPAEGTTAPALRTERVLAYDPPLDAGATFVSDLWATWDLRDDDVPRWRRAWREPIPDGLLARLGGVLWTHSPGPPGGGPATEWERELASHFWSGRARMSTDPPIPTREPCIAPIGPLILGGVFGPVPIPWIGFATIGCPVVLPELNPIIRHGQDVYEPQDGFDPPWLDAFAAEGVQWVAASEPDGWLPEEDIRYVGLSADLALEAVLAERDGELFDLLDQQPCAPGQCDPAPFPFATASASSGPPPAHLLVLSARRRTLWSIDESAMAPGASRIRALDLVDRQWRDLAAQGVELGRPLAAVYSPTDDALFVVDEVRRGRADHARLVRIEVGPRTARSAVVARWPRRTRNDLFALAVDPAGALHLAGARRVGRPGRSRGRGEGPRHGHTVLVRLERTRRGSYRPTALGIERGVLAPGGLRANEHGVTLVLDDPVEGAFPIGIAHDELSPGRGGMGRCL
jgi:hypothetical protein